MVKLALPILTSFGLRLKSLSKMWREDLTVYYFLRFFLLVVLSIFVPYIVWLEMFFCWILSLPAQLCFGPQLPDISFFILLFFTFLCLFALKCLSLSYYWVLFCFFNPVCLPVNCKFNLFTFSVIPNVNKISTCHLIIPVVMVIRLHPLGSQQES